MGRAPGVPVSRRATVALAVALAVVGASMAWCATRDAVPQIAPPPANTPHVVVVLACTVRADQTAPYGGPAHATPWMASVARAGARFTTTIAQAPWTRPGSTAVLTGRHPARVGIAEPAGGRNDRALPDDVVTLAQRFHDAGYTTLGRTANSNLNPLYGFGRGFDAYDGTDRLWRQGMRKVEGVDLVDGLLEELDARHPDGPVYLQLTPIDAHKPSTVTPDEVARWWSGGIPWAVAEYHAMLARLDTALARLDDGLRARGMTPDNTLWVVVADHGEGLSWPAHHGPGHGNYLYTSAVHVPWLVRGPGVGPGVVIDGLSAQVDVAPTLLGALGLPPLDVADGVDRSALLAHGGQTGADEVFTETWFRDSERAARYTPTTMCQVDAQPVPDADDEAPFPTACFAWRDDPTFEDPVDDPAGLAATRAWHRQSRAALTRVMGRTAAPDRLDVEQLKALGYLE